MSSRLAAVVWMAPSARFFLTIVNGGMESCLLDRGQGFGVWTAPFLGLEQNGGPQVNSIGPQPRHRRGRPDAQYTSTSTAAFSADFTMSSNLHSLVFGSLSLADTSGTDSRKLSRKLLLTA